MAYSSIDEYRKNKPDINFSQQDLALAQTNNDFAQALMVAKDLASVAGNDGGKMQEANSLAESARAKYGGYLGGADGGDYFGLGNTANSNSPYAYLDNQLNGAMDALRNANNSAISALEGKKENMILSAKKEKEGQTAGYFQGLDSLDETMANSGYNPMGGQNRTMKADALSHLYTMQNTTENALRQSLTDVEIAIGQLLADGKQKEAQQLFENAKLWASENQQRMEWAFKERQFEYGKEQDETKTALDEGRLLGIYQGQDTLDKQQSDAAASRTAAELAYKYEVLAQKKQKVSSSSSGGGSSKKEQAVKEKEIEAYIKQENSAADQAEINQIANTAREIVMKEEQALFDRGITPHLREYMKWSAGLMYIDQNAPFLNGIEAIYALGAPDELVWKYLDEHYGGRNEDLAQVTVPGHALYFVWKGHELKPKWEK